MYEKMPSEKFDLEKPRKYSFLAKVFHWGFIVIFGYGIYKQVDELDQLSDLSLLKFEMIFAAAFLFLLIIRFIYMRKTQKSSLPAATSQTQKYAAKIVHYGMYFCLGIIAISGISIGTLYWLGFKSGLIIEGVISIHEFSFTAIYFLIMIHVSAAIYHRFLGDGVWNSMVPFWKEKINRD